MFTDCRSKELKRLDWWARRALSLLQSDHVFVVTYHWCPYVRGTDFVRKYGIYNTRTGMRVAGLERITFKKVRRYMSRHPFYIPNVHLPCPAKLIKYHPPDRVYRLSSIRG